MMLVKISLYCILKLNPTNIALLLQEATQNIKNSRITEQNLVLSLPFSLFTATWASCHLPLLQSFFISWTQYSANSKRHKWSIVSYIVSFSGLKMVSFKLSHLDIPAFIKNCAHSKFNLHTLFDVFNYRTSK